ncbi:MAG TPA: hypothetical protein VFB81_01960 [Myxococcales bacterium]|nr:hypothetical protein [Myxococcales bacterium]
MPDEDVIEVTFSALDGSKIDKLAAKVGEQPIGGPGSPHKGTARSPAGQWKLRWQIHGTRRGKYHLQVVVNGEKKFDEDISFDEFGVDHGAYPI